MTEQEEPDTLKVTFRPGEAQFWIPQLLLTSCVILNRILTVKRQQWSAFHNEFYMKRAWCILSIWQMIMVFGVGAEETLTAFWGSDLDLRVMSP